MGIQFWTTIMVVLSFATYIGISIWTRAKNTADFYVADNNVSALANGMATASGWMSAASFISMAGLISFMGRDGSVYLLGWTGGYVLLALLLAPYLRKFGKFTVPAFVGERYYSQTARVVAIICAIFVSFTYVAGQMRGVGIVFSRFLEIDIFWGVAIGMGVVFIYSVLGGMKGITYTQVAQYVVMIFAYMVPAIFISIMLVGSVIPQIGFGGMLQDGSGISLLDKLDQLNVELGFNKYTSGVKSTLDVFCITAALMIGTAGLPHVITRFFTVPRVRDARVSAGYALFFIAILYTTAPAIAAFARVNFIDTVHNSKYEEVPQWFHNWEKTKLIEWNDYNNDGRIQYFGPAVTARNPQMRNEVSVDRDIMVLANPEIANLPSWVIALVVAGGLAAALSTAAGLLLVISTSVSHDLMKNIISPDISDKRELLYARIAAGGAVLIAGHFGVHPPGFVAQVVAFAFGFAASSFFPVIILGIFYKRMNKEGAISGMVSGIVFTAAYIIYFKYINPAANNAEHWFLGISPEGIGTIGMLINLAVSLTVSRFTPPPPVAIQNMVANIRVPR